MVLGRIHKFLLFPFLNMRGIPLSGEEGCCWLVVFDKEGWQDWTESLFANTQINREKLIISKQTEITSHIFKELGLIS